MVVGLIFGSLAILIGSIGIIWYFVVLAQSKKWSIVEGSITKSRIEQGRDSEIDEVIYFIKISFSYEFDNGTYNHESTRSVYASSDINKISEKRSELNGGHITVWCNPKNPKEYMLKEDIDDSKVAIWAGPIFIGIGILMICLT